MINLLSIFLAILSAAGEIKYKHAKFLLCPHCTLYFYDWLHSITILYTVKVGIKDQ